MIPDQPKQTGKDSVGTASSRPLERAFGRRRRWTSSAAYCTSQPATATRLQRVRRATRWSALDLEDRPDRLVQADAPRRCLEFGLRRKGTGLPGRRGPDYDFGSSAILVKTAAGKRTAARRAEIRHGVCARSGQKGRDRVAATRRQRRNQWRRAMGHGERWPERLRRGFRRRIRLHRDRAHHDPKQGGGLTALRIGDGSKVWYERPAPCAPNAPQGCSPAQSAALTAIPGVVFSGSLDGHLRALLHRRRQDPVGLRHGARLQGSQWRARERRVDRRSRRGGGERHAVRQFRLFAFRRNAG